MSQFETTKFVDVDGYEYELNLKYTYYKAYKGAYEGGQQVEPDEPASVEIYECHVDVGFGPVPFPLVEALKEQLEDEILCGDID